jgi:all-trans-8'-apo-beta-carotenal 15,15'-oxygenase
MTPAPSWLRRVGGRFTKNAANTSVTLWQGRLFGLFEGGVPTEIDPESLETVGETNLEGTVLRNFSAHPHRVPKRKTLYNFALRYERHCSIDLFALPDEGKATRFGSVRCSHNVMIHDWIATENHLVFLVSPVLFNTFRYLLGLGAYADNLKWRPELGTEILVIPIDAPDQAVRFDAEPFFVWHFANGFEREGELVVDFVRYEDFKSQETLTQFMTGPSTQPYTGRLSRVRIDPAKKTLKSERLADAICEFPTVSPRVWAEPHRFTYIAVNGSAEAAHGLHDTVLKVDVETGRSHAFDLGGSGRYASEALFAPRPGGQNEDDGYAIVPIYDAQADATHYAVFDASRPSEPALARAHFDHHIPFTFHGTYSSGGRFAGV